MHLYLRYDLNCDGRAIVMVIDINKDEDYTVAALAGIPRFCIGRIYKVSHRNFLGYWKMPDIHYLFKFDNGFGASIITSKDRYSIEQEYELGVMKFYNTDNGSMEYGLTYETGITADVERGNDAYMHELLTRIEALSAH